MNRSIKDVKLADQMLCHVSKKMKGCTWNRRLKPEQPAYGGDELLKSGTIYFMFDEGAFGGPTHSVHNTVNNRWDSQLFGGFTSDSYTSVQRPRT